MNNTFLRKKAYLNLNKSISLEDKTNITSYFIFLIKCILSDYLGSCRKGFLKTEELTCENE